MKKEIMDMIDEEMDRQTQKWGAYDKESPLEWCPILVEEVGEVAKEIHDMWFLGAENTDEYIAELVQVAAVAIRMIEDAEE